MIRGLYSSAWGMISAAKDLDVISNNMANVNTTAFKKDYAVNESFSEVLVKRLNDNKLPLDPTIGAMSLGADVSEIYTSYKQGNFQNTKNPFDLAIDNSDTSFFTIGIPDANNKLTNYYTRDGAFTLNPNGQLVNRDGYVVLGQNGPITLNGNDFVIAEDGTISENDVAVDKLLIKNFTDTRTLQKYGNNLVQTTADTKEQPFNGRVKQGCIEESNVNPLKEMVSMINVMRTYEANQKMVQQQDQMLAKAVNEIASSR